jgi:predicted RNA-binding protein associated with RNAse of E/G family
MDQRVSITLARIGKPARTFREALIDDDGRRLLTETTPSDEICRSTTAELSDHGWIDGMTSVRVVRKIAYYDRPYNIVAFLDSARRPLGYYVDVITPLQRLGDMTSHMTDLIVDVWIRPDGRTEVLDLGELEEAVASGLVSTDLADEIRRHLNRLLDDVEADRFRSGYLD